MATRSFDYLTTPLGNRQLLVEASAGTGKTFALTGLVIRLVLEGVELKKILVVTFTNAATHELKTRIRQRLRDVLDAFRQPEDAHSPDTAGFLRQFDSRTESIERLEAALDDVDEAAVSTIHGFCQRILQQSAFESGAPLEARYVEDADDLFDRAVADFWHLHTYADPWLAVLASDVKPDEFRKHYNNATRYPDTSIEPQTAPLSDAPAMLKQASERLCVVWEERKDEAYELLKATTWTMKGAFHDASVLETTFELLRDKLNDAPFDCSAAIRRISIESILKGAGKNSSAQKAHREVLASEPLFVAADEFMEVFVDAGHSLIRSFIHEVRDRFDELKRTAGILTFDDLLERVDEALAPASDRRDGLLASIRGRWSHALIDEFQDTDPRQYRIFRTAFESRPLVFVGDPKQAIYSFRGADLHAYINAKKDTEAQAGGPHRYMLDTNWRSASKLVQAANALFSRAGEHPFLMDDVPYEPVKAAGSTDQKPLEGDGKPPLVWWMMPQPEKKHWSKDDATSMANVGVVNGIRQLLSSGATINGKPVSASNIAVLVRTNNEGEDIQTALREARIPAVVSKGGDVWDSTEASDVEHLLRAFLRPSDLSSVCTALATTFWGFDATAIHKIRQNVEGLDAVRVQLGQYQKTWRQSGVLRALSQFIEEMDVTARLLSLVDGERRLTNLRHVMELLHEQESRNNRGPDELVQWLRTRESQDEDEKETTELRLETDADAVQVVTIHKSKGLQYDIVIVPFLWSAKEKHNKKAKVLVHDGKDIVYDIGSEDAERRRKLADAERLAEDLRVTYVAVTRAVHRCYVVIGDVNQAEMSPPAYLLHGHEAVEATESIDRRAAVAFEAAKDFDAISSSLKELARDASFMAVEPLPTSAPGPSATPIPPTTFAPRDLPDSIDRKLIPWRVTSYSQLATTDADESFFPAMQGDRKEFFAFASGRNAGSCLHEILEDVDVAALPSISKEPVPTVERLVERKLRAFGLLDPDKHNGGKSFDPQQVVMRFLERLGRTPIPLAGTTLPELDPSKSLREWSFLVPVGAITPEGLADAVSRFAEGEIRREYPRRLWQLRQEALDGYLTGIADFAFEHQGRWFVLDWKSTHLGLRYEDYTFGRLADAALDRHYILQLLVYALGLHRYLRTRLPDYDYERHIGGAGVVFLRGIDGKTDNGFYVLRPPRALIEALDGMLRPVPAHQLSISS